MNLQKLPPYPMILYMTYFTYSYVTFQSTQLNAGILPDFFGHTLPSKELSLWLIECLCTTFGYLLFNLRTIPIKSIIFISALMLPFSTFDSAVFIISTIVIMFGMGAIVAIIHAEIAINVEEQWRGKYVGFGLAGATLIHYLFISIITTQFAIFQLMCLIVLLLLTRNKTFQYHQDNVNPNSTFCIHNSTLVSVVAISILLGLTDGAEYHYFNGDINIFFGDIRLTCTIGYILAGILADYKDRSYLIPATIIILTMRIIGLNIFTTPETYIFNMVINNFCGALIIMTMTITFVDIAAKSNVPMKIAGLGRAIQLPISSMSAIIGAYLWNEISWNALVTTYIIILTIPLATSYINKTKEVKSPEEIEEVINVEGSEKKIIIDKESFDFTAREEDIVSGILDGLSIKEMADKYNIKERTVKYHISNILRKTDTHNQRELLLKITKNR